MKECRKSTRVNASFIVRFRIAKNLLGMSCRSEDISQSGMRLGMLQRLEPGMLLEINFYLQESSEAVTTKAKIIWQGARKDAYFPFSTGIQFIDIKSADRNKIYNYVSKVSLEAKPIGTPSLH